MTNVKQSSEWRDEYYKTIGGSAAAVSMGVDPFKTQAQFALECRHPDARDDLSTKPDIRRGVFLEPIGRQLIEELTGNECTEHAQDEFVYNTAHPFAHVLPDGWLPGREPVEIKWPRPMKFNQILMDGLTQAYKLQAYHTLAVTEAPVLHFAVCCCVTMRTIFVPIRPDAKIKSRLMESEKRFHGRIYSGWEFEQDAAEPMDLPEMGGDLHVMDSEADVNAARSWIEAEQLTKEVSDLKYNAKEKLIEAAGGHGLFEIRDNGVGLLRVHHKAHAGALSFDAKRCVAENPEMEQYKTRKKESKPFKAFILKGW